MIFSQHYLACLSHASYLVGDETTGRAVVVDPRRDVGVYLDEAAERGLQIERVIETHVHADFLSGHLELANRTGALISYGGKAEVNFPMEPLSDGLELSLGEVTLGILETPGHTPESICVVVWERPDDPEPYGVLTGDTLFVGDVGRPDLLASAGPELSPRKPGPTALQVPPHQAFGLARSHEGVPRPRGRVSLREGPFKREQLDHRCTAPDQLCAPRDERRRVHRHGPRGAVSAPSLFQLRRPGQPRRARLAG